MKDSKKNSKASKNRTQDSHAEFLSHLSHELRTPLTTILAWAQILRLGKVDKEKEKRGISVIETNALAMCQVLENISGIAPFKTETKQSKISAVDPVKILKEEVEQALSKADKKSVKIHLDLKLTQGKINADSDRLRRTFQELLDHAIERISKNGTIVVSASVAKSDAGRILRVQITDEILLQQEDEPFSALSFFLLP